MIPDEVQKEIDDLKSWHEHQVRKNVLSNNLPQAQVSLGIVIGMEELERRVKLRDDHKRRTAEYYERLSNERSERKRKRMAEQYAVALEPFEARKWLEDRENAVPTPEQQEHDAQKHAARVKRVKDRWIPVRGKKPPARIEASRRIEEAESNS